jgi:uncharacterized membrane protein
VSIGPVQLIAVGFLHPDFRSELLAQLERLRKRDVVRVIDAIAVYKDPTGGIEVEHLSKLTNDEALALDSTIDKLLRLAPQAGDGMHAVAERDVTATAHRPEVVSDEEVWDVLGDIPNNSAAALILLEHRWAVPIRDALTRAGGFHLSDGLINPTDLVDIGLVTAGEIQTSNRADGPDSCRSRREPMY